MSGLTTNTTATPRSQGTCKARPLRCAPAARAAPSNDRRASGLHTSPAQSPVNKGPVGGLLSWLSGPPGPGGPSGERKAFVTPTETNVRGDALCYMAMGPALLQKVAVGGWRQLAVGGWRRLAVGGWWSLGAVLNKKKFQAS